MVAVAGCDVADCLSCPIRNQEDRTDPTRPGSRSSEPSAAAASRASGQTRPQPPSHIEPLQSPSNLFYFFSFFFSFFILLHTRDFPAALWLHLLRHLRERYRRRRVLRPPTDCIACSTSRSASSYMQVYRRTTGKECKNVIYAATLQGQTNGSVAKVLLGNVII